MHPRTITHRGETLHVLKCDFHAHFSEYNDDPSNTLSTLHAADYDVVALTEHNGRHDDFDMERTFAARAADTFGEDFLVIVGEEVNIDDTANSGHESVHILSLFPEFHVASRDGDRAGKRLTTAQLMPRLREAGGLLFVDHDIFSNYYSELPLDTRWPHRGKYDIDGWEVANGSVGDWLEDDKFPTTLENNLCLEDPATALDEGYILLSNTDFHCKFQDLRMRAEYYNILFAHERTLAGVREALVSRRNVAVAGHQQIATPEALELYQQFPLQ